MPKKQANFRRATAHCWVAV